MCFSVRGQMQVSSKELKEALKKSYANQNDWDSMYEYAVNYFLYTDTAKLYSGLALYMNTIDSSDELNAALPLMKGMVYARKRNYDSAINLLQHALTTGLEKSYFPLIYYSNIQLGQVFRKIGNYPIALLSYDEALNVATQAKNGDAVVHAQIKKSELFFELRSYRRSLDELDNAYVLTDWSNVKKHDILKAAILKNKIRCFEKLDNKDSLLITKKKLDELRSGELYVDFSRISANVEVSRIQGDKKQEIAELKKMLTLTRATGFEDPLNVAVSLGRAYYNNGDYKNALGILDSVEYYVEGLNQLSILKDLYVVKANTYAAMNDMPSALKYYEKNERVGDSINANTSIAKNMEMSASVSTLKNSLGEAVREKNLQRKVVIFTIVISVLSLTLLYLLFRFVVNRNKMHRMQMQQYMKELSFINSHEVRKYLANILGIVQMIKMENSSFDTYRLFEEDLFKNADALDQSIRTLAKKLYGAEGING